MSVDYDSTIHRAQGATVDEAHLVLSEQTDVKQLYVGVTRRRGANHFHTNPPAFDDDHHGRGFPVAERSPRGAHISALQREGTGTTALDRRRRLRDEAGDGRPHDVSAAATAGQRLEALRFDSHVATQAEVCEFDRVSWSHPSYNYELFPVRHDRSKVPDQSGFDRPRMA